MSLDAWPKADVIARLRVAESLTVVQETELAERRKIETQIVSHYVSAFPNYAYTDQQSALDLMLAEITTLRAELKLLREKDQR